MDSRLGLRLEGCRTTWRAFGNTGSDRRARASHAMAPCSRPRRASSAPAPLHARARPRATSRDRVALDAPKHLVRAGFATGQRFRPRSRRCSIASARMRSKRATSPSASAAAGHHARFTRDQGGRWRGPRRANVEVAGLVVQNEQEQQLVRSDSLEAERLACPVQKLRVLRLASSSAFTAGAVDVMMCSIIGGMRLQLDDMNIRIVDVIACRSLNSCRAAAARRSRQRARRTLSSRASPKVAATAASRRGKHRRVTDHPQARVASAGGLELVEAPAGAKVLLRMHQFINDGPLRRWACLGRDWPRRSHLLPARRRDGQRASSVVPASDPATAGRARIARKRRAFVCSVCPASGRRANTCRRSRPSRCQCLPRGSTSAVPQHDEHDRRSHGWR